MKIVPTSQPPLQSLPPARSRDGMIQAEGTASSGTASESAYIVKLSQLVAEEPHSAYAPDDEARRVKVAAIRAQLAAGTYNISGKDVAQKILNVITG